MATAETEPTWGELKDTLRQMAFEYENSADALEIAAPGATAGLRRRALILDRAANRIMAMQENWDRVGPILRGERRSARA